MGAESTQRAPRASIPFVLIGPQAHEDCPVKIALFDLDHTLLPMDSDHAWGEFITGLGWTDPQEFRARNDDFYRHYQMGQLDIQAYVLFATQAIRHRGREASLVAQAQFMQQVIAPQLTPQALALVDLHQRAGDRLALVTATNEFVASPIARALGFEDILAVQLERGPDGWFTGHIEGTPTFREGKVQRVQAWLEQQGVSRDEATVTFYSDSMNDLPLLEWSDEPVATNPDERLRGIAQARGWRILDLF